MQSVEGLLFVQLAEKMLFEDVEVVNQMKELIAELGPGVLFKSYANCCWCTQCILMHDVCSFGIPV